MDVINLNQQAGEKLKRPKAQDQKQTP